MDLVYISSLTNHYCISVVTYPMQSRFSYRRRIQRPALAAYYNTCFPFSVDVLVFGLLAKHFFLVLFYFVTKKWRVALLCACIHRHIHTPIYEHTHSVCLSVGLSYFCTGINTILIIIIIIVHTKCRIAKFMTMLITSNRSTFQFAASTVMTRKQEFCNGKKKTENSEIKTNVFNNWVELLTKMCTKCYMSIVVPHVQVSFFIHWEQNYDADVPWFYYYNYWTQNIQTHINLRSWIFEKSEINV